MKSFVILLAGPIALCLISFAADCAEFSYGNTSLPGKKMIQLSGPIEKGDSEKLLALIKSDPVSFFQTDTIDLSSPGGSVEEALKLAKVIESSALAVLVNTDDICASACFLLYVSGQERMNVGTVLIHRPYFPATTVSPDSHSTYLALTERMLLETRQYLIMKSVPDAIIDKMMSRSSSDAYKLTWQDTINIGAMNPVLEEQAIRTCGISNSQYFQHINSVASNPESFQRDVHCINWKLLVPLKARYALKILGKDRTQQAMQSAARNMRVATDDAPR